jgi:two-component system chemotaxis response regulator CheB
MKILVAEDSVVFRTAIKMALEDIQPDEIKTASNGKICFDYFQQGDFDLVIMDLEMPVMTGPETIKAIREIDKNVPIIIFSAQNAQGANKTFLALEMGATDFVQKTQGGKSAQENIDMIKAELLPKIKGYFKAKPTPVAQSTSPATASTTTDPKDNGPTSSTFNLATYKSIRPSLILIGSSTGGPEALIKIFNAMKGSCPIPIIIVQHMPPVFTEQLAKMLDRLSDLNVSEIKEGDVLQAGHCYIAPGDYHVTLKKHESSYKLNLNQNEKVCFVRPAVDVTWESAAKEVQGSILSVMLTGMGEDGTQGAKQLRKRGESLVIQDKASSVVWGMPGSIYEHGLHTDVAELQEIALLLDSIATL